jgi:hypothetical protein
MCPDPGGGHQGKLGDDWPTSPTPLAMFYRFVPLRQVQARPTHYNSLLLLCSAGGHSYVASLNVFRDGMVRSGAQYPRDALSKGCNIQEFSAWDTPVGGRDNIAPFIGIYVAPKKPKKHPVDHHAEGDLLYYNKYIVTSPLSHTINTITQLSFCTCIRSVVYPVLCLQSWKCFFQGGRAQHDFSLGWLEAT